jgi:hypothetical protein
MHSIAVHACLDFASAANSQTRPDALRQYAQNAKNALEAYLKATEPVDLGEEPYGEGCTCVSGTTR